MVGDSLTQRGGIATLQKNHLKSAPGHIHTTHVASHDEGSLVYRVGFFLWSVLKVARLSLTKKFDVVHIHQSGGGSLVRKSLIVRLARLQGVPTVLHGHAGWSDSTLLTLPRPLRGFVTSSLGKVDAVVALSQSWAHWYHDVIGVEKERIRVIHTPAPPVENVGASRPNGRVRILSVSRLREEKGTFDLLRAFAELTPELRDGCELILAGDGDIAQTRVLAHSLGVADHVTLPGWVDGAELSALLRSADIFVSASHHEGIPLSLLEAMSEGIASISTDVGGVPEIVTNGNDCLLVSPKQPRELLQALTSLATNPEKRRHMSLAALDTSAANGVDGYWSALQDVYALVTGAARVPTLFEPAIVPSPVAVNDIARVSIVVPTFNRAGWLDGALDSLMAQRVDALVEFEIVVVDNASTDHTASVVAAASKRSPVPIKCVFAPVPGDGAARNSGVLAATHDLVAFFDDDQFADKEWIASLVDVVRSTGALVVGGPVALELDQVERLGFGPVTRRDMLRESILYDRVQRYGVGDLPGTCNLLVSRRVFDTIGYFDEEMNGGSDFDFLRRAIRAGFALWYSPRASVVHRVGGYRKTDEYFRRESSRNGWGLAEETLTDRGARALGVECVARLAQACLVNAPMLVLSTVRRDRADATDRRVLLWRAEGFLRRTTQRFAPQAWSQDAFVESHQFAGHESQQIVREMASKAMWSGPR